MKDRVVKAIIWGCALGTLCAGAFMTVGSLRRSRSLLVRMEGKLAELKRLLEMQADAGYFERAVDAFNKLENPHPVPLSVLVKAALGTEGVEIRPGETVALSSGWSATRAEVVVANASLQKIAEMIADAESRQPPWRVRECTITASRQASNFGQARLVMEGLEKTKQAGR